MRLRWKLLVLALTALAAGCLVTWASWMRAGASLGREHLAYARAHQGFSFPAHVVTRAVAPTEVAPARRVAEAKARGYRAECKQPGPGTFCEKALTVVPRSGATLEPLLLGVLLGEDQELRTHLPLAQAPQHLVDAILASEDRSFRTHRGVNFSALLRAAFANTREGQYAQGGSTLTMQVVRSLSQRTEKTLWRKLREAAQAMGLERAVGKDAVLQLYLDVPYLGQKGGTAVCGFQEAARHYFGVDAQALDLAQAATLVAILPGPGHLAPDRFPEACLQRRNRILNELGRLFHHDVTAALARPLGLSKPSPLPPERFPSYLQAVRLELERRLPKAVVYGAGLTVETGLDVVMQQEAEALFPAKLAAYAQLVAPQKSGPLQAVGLALDAQTGAVRALYGGLSATATSFNRATQAHRQPGSSFKPLVYALAFSQRGADGAPRFTAASTEPNAPRLFKTPKGDWRPLNVGGESSVTACLAQGLAWSQNIATASLLEELGGPAPLTAFAKEAGFDTTAFPQELGLALGQAEVTPLEMAQLAALIANGGQRVRGSTVLRAVDGAGKQLLSPEPAVRVLSAEAAALTRELMRLVIDVGTGGAIRGVAGEAGYAGPAMGKTGTTDSEKDLWFVGATPTTAAVVWLGYDRPVRVGAAAADLAAPLWGWWLGRSARVDGLPLPDFSAQPALSKKPICTVTGKLPNETCAVINAPFLPGTAPKALCPTTHPPAVPIELLPGHESLWKRKAREAAEAAEAAPP